MNERFHTYWNICVLIFFSNLYYYIFLARTNVSVEIKRSMLWSYVALIVLFGILAALVQPVINSLPFWIRIIQMKNIWALVSAGVYTCAISGLIFDIIRSPQMYRITYSYGI
jgi:hypothetical protein